MNEKASWSCGKMKVKLIRWYNVLICNLKEYLGFIGWVADVHYNGGAFFLSLFIYAIATFISSVPILGFYYIVKAAKFYLRQNGQLDEEVTGTTEE